MALMGQPLWSRAASLEIGEMPLEAGQVVHTISVGFAAIGLLDAAPLKVASPAVALAGAGLLSLAPAKVHVLAVSFAAAAVLTAPAVRMTVLDVALAGAGTISAALIYEGIGTPTPEGRLVATIRLDRPAGPAVRLGLP